MRTAELGETPGAIAPNGSDVRILAACDRGSMACFELAPGKTSVSVSHATLDELWYILSGRGEMWRQEEGAGHGEVTEVREGIAVTITPRTAFQFRSATDESLVAVAVTVPPWPGIGDMSGHRGVTQVDGPWQATVPPGFRKREAKPEDAGVQPSTSHNRARQ